MWLNPEEFKRRSDELFASSYLTSVGIIQSVALGILAYKFFDSNLSRETNLQTAGSFLAILMISHEYSWWILLVRRTPGIGDTVFPYVLGAAEFWAMYTVPETSRHATNEWWFFALGMLGVVGMVSLQYNRSNCTNDVFAQSRWLKRQVIRNLNWGTVIVGVATVLMFWMWTYQKQLAESWKVFVFIELYALQIGFLILSAKFMENVRDEFGRRLAASRMRSD